jgi:hypothetical protein
MEKGITKNQIITALTRSPHGALTEYIPVGRAAAKQDAEFFAHLIAWNERNGQIRDSKVALPIISLGEATFDGELADNSFAHLATLDPRNLVRAIKFGKEIKTPNHGRALRRMIAGYLEAREANPRWWEHTAMQHRASMKTLYALSHIKPSKFANDILFAGKKFGVFKDIATLKDMTASDAASVIMTKRIPFLVAVGALGARVKETPMVMALIERMSATELVTNTKMLDKLGVKKVPELRAAFEAGLKKVAESKQATFKTTRAAEAVGAGSTQQKLRGAQEKQITKLAGVDGNWLVIGDKSGSMDQAIDLARMLSATLAKAVKGDVHLVFADTTPRYINATGKDYDAILAETKRITANGGTSLGCGVTYATDKRLDVDGIAVVSDSAENTPPFFAPAYKNYVKLMDKEPPVYLYKTSGETTNALENNLKYDGIDLQVFDMRGKIDYFSLPNIIATMRTNRYSLVDEIMATPLLRLQDVFNSHTRKEQHA